MHSDLVKNDVLVEKAIEGVAQSLIIYVSGRDKHEVVNYTSELYCLVWDVACLKGKPQLDIRCVWLTLACIGAIVTLNHS